MSGRLPAANVYPRHPTSPNAQRSLQFVHVLVAAPFDGTVYVGFEATEPHGSEVGDSDRISDVHDDLMQGLHVRRPLDLWVVYAIC